MRTKLTAAAALLAAAALTLPTVPAQGAAAATVTVDFTTPVTELAASDYGLDITGYGNQHYITNDTTHRENVRRQGFGILRMELTYDASGQLVCGGSYCDTAITGDAWVTAIRDLGAEPMLILPADGRRTAAEDLADAKNIYNHFKAAGTPVRKFIYGNEHDNSGNPKKMTADEYSARYNQVHDALHALDPAVQVGGPALSSYEPQLGTPYMDTFLTVSGSRVDFIDYHDYGAGYTRYTPEQLLTTVIEGYSSDIADLKARVARLTGRDIPIQIGEWNMDYEDPDGTLMLSHLATVWGSAALGTMLESGVSTLLYGDKNGNATKNTGLGITSTEGEGGIPVSAPTPIYHGLGMFTGEGLFRRFGATVVPTTSSSNLLHAFASTGGKNIVLVNADTTATTTSLNLTGYTSGSAQIWQTTADASTPHQTGTLPISNGTANPTLPARSVTTLVLADQGLKGEYYASRDLTGPVALTRLDSTVNFDWGPGTPSSAVPVDNFSVRWTGQVDVPAAATYSFITTTDDGVRLWVDGQLIVNAWTDHSKRDDTGSIALTAGKHAIKLEYYENGYDAIAQLSWSSPNLARQVIPAARLIPAV
ncbi:glycosyl hydrolase family 39 [Kribbella antiqua]|uniref:Glycosyl hydrolase family 39 n=1 Tax=Kribbella antiqua TaxID=2512217 RepID=A0A4R2IBN7_9ACTN|nr:PA14 domain-containing protein [Kribbella antiqua]TCO41552.1 glycosyl hydrolase family 39 [Kribbella antiqua]